MFAASCLRVQADARDREVLGGALAVRMLGLSLSCVDAAKHSCMCGGKYITLYTRAWM